MPGAVIFDAFGTVIQISNRQNPYRQLLREGVRQGRPASPDDLRTLMTFSGGLKEAADLFGISLTASKLQELKAGLAIELACVKLFDDALPAITLLRDHGMKIAVCSNLSYPYCEAVRSLLPGLDAYGLSAEMGLMKPDPEIYRGVCLMLNGAPGQVGGTDPGPVLMIGDSRRCDRDGPLQIGVTGYHLDRSGQESFRNLLQFARAVIDPVLPSWAGE